MKGQIGEAKPKKPATQKPIEQYPYAAFAADLRLSVTREHIPPKALFDNSHRPDKLVMRSCIECNKGTSTVDLTVATASRCVYDNATQEQLDHRKPAQQVKKRHLS